MSDNVKERFSSLRADKLIETADRVASRIVGRFPRASIGNVAVAVADLIRNAVDRSEAIRRPNWYVRVGVGALAVVVVAGGFGFAWNEFVSQPDPWRRLLEYARLASGVAVPLSAAAIFLWTLETRIRRGRTVEAIHQLRALAHIIDMHQLAKDPESPVEAMEGGTIADLRRYLTYCTELLSLLSKVGQLYVQDFPDGTSLSAVDQFENLATSLSRKIWQKITLLEDVETPADGSAPPPA